MSGIAARVEQGRTLYARQHRCTRVHDLLSSHAEAIGDAEAAIDGDVRWDYATLSRRVDTVARALIANGVERGDRVATMAPSSIDFWVQYLAAVSIGAVWMGLNPRYRIPEYAYLLGDAAPRIVLCLADYEGRDYHADLRAAGPAVPRFVPFGDGEAAFEAFVAEGTGVSDAALAARRAAVDPEDIAVIVYTSGTTGKPKGAMLSHRAVMASALTNMSWLGDALESTLNVAPINHVGALNNVCMTVFAYGGRIVFHHRVDAAAIAAIARRERLTYLVAGPTSFAMFAQGEGGGEMSERLGGFRAIVIGGGVTPEAVLTPLVASGVRVHNVFGMTETCGTVSATEPGASPRAMAETFGRVLPGAELRIGDADGNALPIGTTGEIQIKGPYVTSGYFGRPDATAEAFTADGFFRTGDLGVANADGSASYVGRLKEMFKSGGYNIYPAEIEQALAEHPAVLTAAVLPVPHPVFQEVGHAFVESEDGALDEAALRDFLKPRLANYKLPKSFTIEPALPRLPNYKIDKQALKARLAAQVAA